TRIVSSPLIRAKESAEIVAEKLGIPIEKIEVDKRFIEFNHSTECQGKKAGFPETDPSEREDFYLRHKDGENHDDVRARVMEGLFDLEKKY
ncbi:MAG: histidine phosphatase family protein, partial [Patescibacteria group bacterium]